MGRSWSRGAVFEVALWTMAVAAAVAGRHEPSSVPATVRPPVTRAFLAMVSRGARSDRDAARDSVWGGIDLRGHPERRATARLEGATRRSDGWTDDAGASGIPMAAPRSVDFVDGWRLPPPAGATDAVLTRRVRRWSDGTATERTTLSIVARADGPGDALALGRRMAGTVRRRLGLAPDAPFGAAGDALATGVLARDGTPETAGAPRSSVIRSVGVVVMPERGVVVATVVTRPRRVADAAAALRG